MLSLSYLLSLRQPAPAFARRSLGTFLLLALLVSSLGDPAGAVQARQSTAGRAAAADALGYAPGVVLVGLQPGASLESALARLPGSKTGSQTSLGVTPLFTGIKDDEGGFSGPQVYRVRLPQGAGVEASARLLGAESGVAFAEPDYIASAAATPNDPRFGSQWGLAKVNAPAAWDLTKGAATTVIAVIDSGIDRTHQDLAGQLWTNPGEIAGNGLDDDHNDKIDDVNGWNFLAGNGDVNDENGHGTQVAGVIAAATNNGQGIAGICWNCRLMIVKVMQSSGAVNYSDIAAGVAYAVEQGAAVINLSLGGYADSETLRTAIESAARSAVIVAGAGNDNKTALFYPAAYPGVIGAAATSEDDSKAAFSNYGDWVDVAAPGVSIETTFAGNNGYGAENGTSMSAPFVAGLAGLLRSQHPDWSSALVQQQIFNTADSIGPQNPGYAGLLGGGRLNALRAVTTAPQPQLTLTAWAVDGAASARPAPGQTFDLALTLANTWKPARGLQATLSESDAYTSIPDPGGMFGDLNTGQTGGNAADPFRITLAANTPYSRAIPFTVSLTGEEGYSLTLPFTLTVRSGIEELPNGTVIEENTTWTNDKTYILKGNVTLASGYTLTIQPGTLIKTEATKWLRIDGTLIANGTAEAPIVFTTNAADKTKWAGLRFTDTSGPSVFDAEGIYLSGSLLRYVQVMDAEIGVTVQSPPLLIDHSTFTRNTTGLKTGTSSTRVTGCTFSSNVTAMDLNGGEGAVLDNLITQNNEGIIGSTGGRIAGNTFRENQGAAIRLYAAYGSPSIRDNRILGNGSGIQLSGLQGVDVQHNLIANSTAPFDTCPTPPCPPTTGQGAALSLSIDSSPSSIQQNYPTLAYNPDRDEYLVLWTQWLGTDNQVKGQRLSAEGQAIGLPFTLAVTGMYEGRPSLVYNPERQEYAAAWGGNYGVFMQRLSGSATFMGPPLQLSSQYTGGKTLLVYQASTQDYLVFWEETQSWPVRIFGRRVTSDLLSSGTTLELGAGLNTTLYLDGLAFDSGRSRALVTFHTGASNLLQAAWIESTQGSNPPVFTLAQEPEGFLENADLAFNVTSDRYLVAWEPNSLPQAHAIRDASIPANGTGPISVTLVYSGTPYARSPKVAYNSTQNQFLVMWASDTGSSAYGIFAQGLTSEGALVGERLTLSTPQNSVRNMPSLIYNSQRDEYLAVWRDCRKGSCELFGQRLGAGGQLLDNPWSAADETDPGVNFSFASPTGVRFNTIIHNKGLGVRVGGQSAGQALFEDNNWFDNGDYDVYLETPANVTVTLGANYWGGITGTGISSRIYDCYDTDNGCNNSQSSTGRVVRQGALAGPDQTAPAFVQAAAVNPDPLGIQQGTFEITFSRPMITSTLPALSFHDIRQGTLETLPGLEKPIRAFASDTVGRVWFAYGDNMPVPTTEVGVAMYNGQDWTTFTTKNSGLTNDGISTLFAASTGDLWIGHGNSLQRLQGTTWITYTIESTGQAIRPPVNSIAEDGSGNIWIGDSMGIGRFNGLTWERVLGNGSDYFAARKLAGDRQGRMWALTDKGVYRFDSQGHTLFDQSNGLQKIMYLSDLFVDSQDRVWVGFIWSQDGSQLAAMFDGDNWTYFGTKETGGAMIAGIQSIAADIHGNLWFKDNMNTGIAIFDGQIWKRGPEVGWSSIFAFDARGNLWLGNDQGARVLWGGEDYPVVDNGRWLSPTRYQATYDLNPIVPKGSYAIEVDGAAGLDGMATAPDASGAFVVDYAGYVTDNTPPSTPLVTALNDGSLTTLTINWSSSDPQGLAQYRYCAGTTPGGCEVVAWTYVSKSTTSVTLNGLLLVRGRTYYATVAAQNTSGLWSLNGKSNPVVAGTVTHLKQFIFLPVMTR